jgi:dTDP-4-amino-4,6-dideoxygalactose transaminase
MAGTATSPDIPLFDLRLEDEDLAAVAAVLRAGTLRAGARTRAFEQAFADHLGVRHAIAVASCTAALHLAYRAAGVGPGDEVIVPSMTFAATANAVVYCGATPVFADVVGQRDLALDPADVERRITARTKAVSVVHFGGYAADVARLRALCDAHGLALIEDAAHAPSAQAGGRRLGTFGLAGCFSLFSNKVLSVGEGGLLSTDDDDVAAFVRDQLGDGSIGANYRFDEPRAALALSRLPRLDADVARRQELTLRYRERLAGVEGLTIPYEDADVAGSSCYVMPLMVDDPERQNPLRQALRERHGVQTSLLYPGVHEFTAYRERYPGISLPRTELASRTEVTVPLFPHMTEAQHDRVVTGIAEELAA